METTLFKEEEMVGIDTQAEEAPDMGNSTSSVRRQGGSERCACRSASESELELQILVYNRKHAIEDTNTRARGSAWGEQHSMGSKCCPSCPSIEAAMRGIEC